MTAEREALLQVRADAREARVSASRRLSKELSLADKAWWEAHKALLAYDAEHPEGEETK